MMKLGFKRQSDSKAGASKMDDSVWVGWGRTARAETSAYRVGYSMLFVHIST